MENDTLINGTINILKQINCRNKQCGLNNFYENVNMMVSSQKNFVKSKIVESKNQIYKKELLEILKNAK